MFGGVLSNGCGLIVLHMSELRSDSGGRPRMCLGAKLNGVSTLSQFRPTVAASDPIFAVPKRDQGAQFRMLPIDLGDRYEPIDDYLVSRDAHVTVVTRQQRPPANELDSISLCCYSFASWSNVIWKRDPDMSVFTVVFTRLSRLRTKALSFESI